MQNGSSHSMALGRRCTIERRGDLVEANEVASTVVVAMRRQPEENDEQFDSRRAELVGLCEAANGMVSEIIVQARPDVDGRTYLGSGKIQTVAEAALANDADVIVFDAQLTPAQVRNIEEVVPCRVIDRTQLILDIFALRARSRTGRLQVEIAQLQYWLPRLTGKGRALSRLGGGIGTRGPGETKLETDRRRIRDRITKLRQDLAVVRKNRSVQRDKRSRLIPVVALVGYTNAGKTTVLTRWTTDRWVKGATEGADRLFDTLDPLARRVRGGSNREIVLLDTVGFVQDLPHFLVEAFQATLEEVRMADLIVHVVEASEETSVRMDTTYRVLEELEALGRPVLTFYNKMDLASSRPAPDLRAMKSLYGSAATGDGMESLYQAVDEALGLDPVTLEVEGRAESKEFWRLIGKHGRVLQALDTADGRVLVTLQVARRHASVVRNLLLGDLRDESEPALVEHLGGEEQQDKEDWFSSTW